MESWQERVVEEKKELDDKILRLFEFISNDENLVKISQLDRVLLSTQQEIMLKLSGLLQARINNF